VIGETRFIDGPVIPVLYPGEMASSMSVEQDADGDWQVARWVVEPLPGWRGRWLRLHWRLRGRKLEL
jgi:hypothetical protein